MGALIPERKNNEEDTGDRVVQVPVDEIKPSRFQPRTVFNQEALQELAESIRERGVIQPVILSKKPKGYELIAGERRWRAVTLLGYKTIPAIVRIVRDSEALEMAIIENIQRENLTPIEEAFAYERFMNEFGLTQEQVAQKVGKSRSAVANFMRLLKLPDLLKADLSDGRLTMGHARALLALEHEQDQLKMREQILHAGMNVRQVENHVKVRSGKPKKKLTANQADVFIKKVQVDLERRLGVKVEVKAKAKGGVISVHYHDVDELNRVIDIIEGRGDRVRE